MTDQVNINLMGFKFSMDILEFRENKYEIQEQLIGEIIEKNASPS